MEEEDLVVKKRVRDESESDTDSPEVKRLRENLLDSLDDDPEICASNQDLDSFMKSFEEEIAAVGDGGEAECVVVDVASDSCESRPDLGYLLEASDDELGIPPPTKSASSCTGEVRTELVRVGSSDIGGELWEIPGYDAFGSGFGEAGGYVALDGLF